MSVNRKALAGRAMDSKLFQDSTVRNGSRPLC